MREEPEVKDALRKARGFEAQGRLLEAASVGLLISRASKVAIGSASLLAAKCCCEECSALCVHALSALCSVCEWRAEELASGM